MASTYPVPMTYLPGFCKKYTYNYNSDLCTVTASADSFEVTAYAFSNVDAFGAQVLCWHGNEAYAAISSKASLLSSQSNLSAWSQLSTTMLADMAGVEKEGWMSVNSRVLKPAD